MRGHVLGFTSVAEWGSTLTPSTQQGISSQGTVTVSQNNQVCGVLDDSLSCARGALWSSTGLAAVVGGAPTSFDMDAALLSVCLCHIYRHTPTHTHTVKNSWDLEVSRSSLEFLCLHERNFSCPSVCWRTYGRCASLWCKGHVNLCEYRHLKGNSWLLSKDNMGWNIVLVNWVQ